MIRWLMVAALFIGTASAEAQVQGVAGYSRARPIVRTASDAPTATIRQLRFNNDPKNLRLYSAGDDKVVRSYSVAPRPGGGFQLTPAAPIAWPIYRAARGVVYAMDVQTTSLGDRLAFGGFGAKTSWVNLLHVNRADKAELHRDEFVSQRDNVVYAVAFNPSGTQLAVGHNRSEVVLLWDLLREQSSGKNTPLRTGLSNVWHLAYSPSGNRLALAGFRNSSQFWEVQEWDVSPLKFRRNQAVASKAGVTGLAWPDESRWVASTTEVNFVANEPPPITGMVRSGNDQVQNLGQVLAVVAPRGPAPFVIAVFDPDAKRTQIACWDGQQTTRTDLAGGTFIGKDVAIDVSRDGRFVAAAGAVIDGGGLPAYAVRLWDAASREPLAQFPDVNRSGTLGAPIANVGVIPGERVDAGGVTPYKIGFTWGPEPKGDLPAYQFQFDRIAREKQAIMPYTAGLGRELQNRSVLTGKIGGKPVVLLMNVNDKLDWWRLPLWADRKPTCYAINERLNLLALGYNDDILLCDLAKIKDQKLINKDPAVLRSFYGHEAPVTCLSISSDPPLLLTGSTDGTICAWKINDLIDVNRRPRSELGVVFDIDPRTQDPTVMQDPAPGSVGAEAGFQKGQQVTSVVVAGEPLPRTQWKNYLASPIPGKELAVVVKQGNRENSILMVVAHDALWTLYPQQDGNWLVWTQEGHFDAPVEAIDRLSWHINLNIDERDNRQVTPGEVMSLNGRDFQELFHKPEVVNNGLQRLIADKPREHFIPPSLQIDVQGDKVLLTATPNGTEPLTEVELWLNGHRLGQLQRAALGDGKQTAKLAAQIPPGYRRADGNQLLAVAAIAVIDPQTRKPAQVYNRKRIQLPDAGGTPATVARKLHYVGVGVSKLDFNLQGLNSLEFPGHDAVELGLQLSKSAALDAGFFETLADYEGCRTPNEANIVELLKNLKGRVGPDDLAVVFFAGHGVNTPGGFRFIAQDTKDLANCKISDRTINDLLAQLPCRTMLILDTCHAQGVQVPQNLQDWPGFGLGPMILAACDSSKESFEDQRLQLQPDGLPGHGLFTGALLEGLLLDDRRVETRIKKDLPKRDANNDGRLTIEEWCLYAQQRTAMLSDLGISPFSRPGKDPYTPKVLPSFSFLDHKGFTFAGKR